MVEAVHPAVGFRARAAPGKIDRARRPEKLLHRVRRRRGVFGENEKLRDQPFQSFGIELALMGDVFGLDHARQRLVEGRDRHAADHLGVSLDESPPGVESQPRISRRADQAVDADCVHADIEHGLEHAWHGLFGAGAHRNEQRRAGVPELASGRGLQTRDALGQPLPQRGPRLGVAGEDRAAQGHGKDEGGRDRQAERGHSGQFRGFRAI